MDKVRDILWNQTEYAVSVQGGGGQGEGVFFGIKRNMLSVFKVGVDKVRGLILRRLQSISGGSVPLCSSNLPVPPTLSPTLSPALCPPFPSPCPPRSLVPRSSIQLQRLQSISCCSIPRCPSNSPVPSHLPHTCPTLALPSLAARCLLPQCLQSISGCSASVPHLHHRCVCGVRHHLDSLSAGVRGESHLCGGGGREGEYSFCPTCLTTAFALSPCCRACQPWPAFPSC